MVANRPLMADRGLHAMNFLIVYKYGQYCTYVLSHDVESTPLAQQTNQTASGQASNLFVEKNHRCFFALARTRASNMLLRIGVWVVWNGFNIVCAHRKLHRH
jgi:hypothetical protein